MTSNFWPKKWCGYRGADGTSLVEVMVAVAVTIIGFVGILDLQTASIKAAADGRAMRDAMQLAEHFAETLKTEAIEWTNNNDQSFDQAKFVYLKNAPAQQTDGTSTNWLISTPVFTGAMGYLSTNSQQGGVAYDAGILTEFPPAAEARFCVHYRLTWTMAPVLMRADIRVFWIRPGGARGLYENCPLTMATDLTTVNSISLPLTLMVNVFLAN